MLYAQYLMPSELDVLYAGDLCYLCPMHRCSNLYLPCHSLLGTAGIKSGSNQGALALGQGVLLGVSAQGTVWFGL